ncbi:FAD/NAD(P)-binding protein [Chthonobacter albigriseus]|uniref:FAD/NAD(P)-binding protein n=1 Tax=Chthonobacter albigriseus TaxID=1683161 RepID=UPI0031403E71
MTTVAIIGGGFTGAAVAIHLAAAVPTRTTRIVVFEPRRRLGAGLAYDTEDPTHRINVPAARMSVVPGDDEHFVRWLASVGEPADDPQAFRPDGTVFPKRGLFGRYVAAQIAPLVSRGIVEYVREAVADVGRSDGRWVLTTASGAKLAADVVVNATTHPPPSPPAALRPLGGHPRFIADPNGAGALEGIGAADRVLLVGTGLTGADVIASLTARGHYGKILAVSRHGLVSRGHAPVPQEPFGDFLARPASTALSLLRTTRRTVREAAERGITWHAVFDALRGQGQDIWTALPVPERRRLVRHLRSYWDVHRFRIAPQVEDALEQRLADGSLEVRAASLKAAGIGEDGTLSVDLRRRGGREITQETADVVVVATGPAHGSILEAQPHLASLAAAGLVVLDEIGLGLSCDRSGRALDRSGQPVPTFLIAGPLARGTFGELMGLPQVSTYAAFIAAELASMARVPSMVTGTSTKRR